VRAVRQAFPSEAIAIDGDGLCTLGQMEMFYRLEDFHLRYIEQPLPADDLVGHAMLQSSLRTPICLDQSITSPERVEQAIDLASCRQMNIDIGRVGGITPALTIRSACEAAHVSYALGGANLGALSALAAAAFLLPNRSEPADTCLFDREAWLIADETAARVSAPADEVSLSISDLIGAGADMNINTLSVSAIERATIR
jgi:O-succinylbenzoate synthase